MNTEITRLNEALSGRYVLSREVGRGGMATVYLATEAAMNREVAFKVFDPGLSNVLGRKRFVREVEMVAKLNHPNIVPIFAAGEADGLLYYVMPYIGGHTIRHRIVRKGPIPAAETTVLGIEVAAALGHAHARGVVHRDIKPENILLSDGRPVIADFGIAKALLTAGGETLTRTGLVIGTPRYMSPEQAAGTAVDGRADVYALGRVMYEMLTGDVPAAHRVNYMDVPDTLVPVLSRAIEQRAEHRFQTAREFEEALRGVGPQNVRSAKRASSRQLSIAVGILALTIVIAVIVSLITNPR